MNSQVTSLREPHMTPSNGILLPSRSALWFHKDDTLLDQAKFHTYTKKQVYPWHYSIFMLYQRRVLRQEGQRVLPEQRSIIPPPVSFRSSRNSHIASLSAAMALLNFHIVSGITKGAPWTKVIYTPPVSFRSSINSHIVKKWVFERERERERERGRENYTPTCLI